VNKEEEILSFYDFEVNDYESDSEEETEDSFHSALESSSARSDHLSD